MCQEQRYSFTRMFYGRSSEYLWEMDDGQVHRIPQGEGGEQADPMMPLLYSLGQQGALEAAHSQFTRGERLLAFLDDTFIVTPNAAAVGPAYGSVQDALRNHCGILVHVGKTKIWNRAGNRPVICDALERMARQLDPRARVRRGSQVPTDEQGIKVLGTPLGHSDFVSQPIADRVGGATHSLEPNPQDPGRAERVADSVALCVGTCKLPHPCFAPSSNISVRSSPRCWVVAVSLFYLAAGPGAI